MAKTKTYDVHAIGRRKCAVARVYLVNGSGKITVNKKELDDYFPTPSAKFVATQPLNLLKLNEKYDITVNVSGGGMTGQASAIRLGISRALSKLDASSRPELRKAGFLTRDARKVERKKYGVRGARRAFQFSKR